MSNEEMELVMPGERLSTEEEFLPSSNTFVEAGNIYSLVPGRRVVEEGKIEVKSVGREIIKFKRNMLVLGTVVGDLKAVLFVDIDNMELGNKEYVAIKDGKVVLAHRGPPPRSGFGHDRDRGRPQGREQEERPASLSDIILARILFDEGEAFVLDMRGPETGVVNAVCDSCGATLDVSTHGDALMCPECKHIEHRKISSLYGRPSEIRKMLEESAQAAQSSPMAGPERSARPERPEHSDRPRYERRGGYERHDRSDRHERPDRSDRHDSPERRENQE